MHSGIVKSLSVLALFSLVGCVEVDDKAPGLLHLEQAVGPAKACAGQPAEVDGFIDWLNGTSKKELDRPPRSENGTIVLGCGLRSDVSQTLSRGNFTCLDEVANVDGVGEGTMRMLVSCGRSYHAVSPDLYWVFEGAVGASDQALPFSVAENELTISFANGATEAQLDAVPGFGPTLVGRIVAARPIPNVYWLRNIDGIGLVKLGALKASAADWTAPVAHSTWTDSLADLSDPLRTKVELLRTDLEQISYMTTPVLFAGVYAYYVGGDVDRYEVTFLQMLDPEGGIQEMTVITLDRYLEMTDMWKGV